MTAKILTVEQDDRLIRLIRKSNGGAAQQVAPLPKKSNDVISPFFRRFALFATALMANPKRLQNLRTYNNGTR